MVGDKTKEKECDDGKEPIWECPPIKNITHPLRYYEFSPEEIKALEECDKESFYQRCLPFSTLFGTLTYLGVKKEHSSKKASSLGIVTYICDITLLRGKQFLVLLRQRQQKGFLKRSPHFGVFPKVIMAALIGHLYGRLSYIPDCERKLRRLPNSSYLGGVMRKYHIENDPPKNPKGR